MAIYRQYEDARTLQARLDEVRAEFEAKAAQGLLDAEDYADYALEIGDLEERVNFAWQDEEYEEDLAREAAFYECYEGTF